ncbi:MAG: hypothetical protein KF789_02485 [Bdellovibrionaceae bacterium]|nr:hypothetical protein [Pseudobdellovibrionaceae bacterium]
MRLNEELLEKVEEFFDLIPNDEGDVELDSSMDRLRRLLEEDIDGRTSYSGEELAFKMLSQMEEIWDLIPTATKEDSDLEEYYEEIMDDLEGEDEFPGEEFEDDDFDESKFDDGAEEGESWD